MSELPDAIGLSAVQAELERSGDFRDLEKSIRSALVTQSCFADLKEAADCLAALRKIRSSVRGFGSRERDTTEGALFRMAIHLYARATVTRSKKGHERGPIQIASHLSAAELRDHGWIVDVRNQAQAHVYPNEEIDDLRWHEAGVLLVRIDDGWQPCAASHRVVVAGAMIQALERQVPVALRIMGERSSRRLREVTEALSRNMGPELIFLLERHKVDLASFFGGEGQARSAVNAARSGVQDWIGGA